MDWGRGLWLCLVTRAKQQVFSFERLEQFRDSVSISCCWTRSNCFILPSDVICCQEAQQSEVKDTSWTKQRKFQGRWNTDWKGKFCKSILNGRRWLLRIWKRNTRQWEQPYLGDKGWSLICGWKLYKIFFFAGTQKKLQPCWPQHCRRTELCFEILVWRQKWRRCSKQVSRI